MEQLLHEPRLPKISREFQTPVQQQQQQQRDAPTKAVEVEAEAAAAAAQALIEEVEAQAMKEEKKRKQKQKKKQKEKEKRSQAKTEDTDQHADDQKSDDKATPQELSEDEPPETSQRQVLSALRKRDSSPESDDAKGFEETHRIARRKSKGAKPEGKAATSKPATSRSLASKDTASPLPSNQANASGGKANATTARAAETTGNGSTAAGNTAGSSSFGASSSAHCGSRAETPASTPARGSAGGMTHAVEGTSLNGFLKASASSPSKASPARTPARGSGGGSNSSGVGAEGSRTSSTVPSPVKTVPLGASPTEPLRPNGIGADRHQEPESRPIGSKARHSPGSMPIGAGNAVGAGERFNALPKGAALPPRGAAPVQETPTPEGAVSSRPSPSSSSRASPGAVAAGGGSDDDSGGVIVYPEQLVTQDGGLGEYAQFVCKICNLVLRQPLVLPCAHMFCSTCFNQWVRQKRPNVICPTCEQAVRPQEVVHFESRSSAGGGALALLHRLYSGLKVRCVYHPELLGAEATQAGLEPLTAEARRAKASNLSCTWRGALLDYAVHLGSCKVHGVVGPSSASSSRASAHGVRDSSSPLAEALRPSPAASSSQPCGKGGGPIGSYPSSVGLHSVGSHEAPRLEPAWTHITGAFQALAAWHSPEAGALSVQLGTTLWVTSTDESGEWAYACLLQVPFSAPPPDSQGAAWVPRAVLQRAVYPACSVFDAQGQAQGLSLAIGDLVHVYHREPSGWTYGARLERTADLQRQQQKTGQKRPEEVGWFPEACVSEPLPVS